MDINDILNLDGVDINEKIVDAIDMSRVELEKLTTDLTCKLYSSAVKDNLNKKHVINRIINTKDLGLPYEHQFNIAYGNGDYYLIDLTYKQFKSADFIDVLLQGYTKIDNDDLQDYLSIVGNGITNITLEELFFSKTK